MKLRDHLFYEEPGITLYCGDCRALLPLIGSANLVVTDPPYGICAEVDNRRVSGGSQTRHRLAVHSKEKIHGDTRPFDPSPLLVFPRLVLFGAQNYAAKLPSSNGWIVWDKRLGLEEMTGWPLGEGELAWTKRHGRDSILAKPMDGPRPGLRTN